jgi:phosphoenolpyruvate-protein phosphotransferase (PTS system enzyme I)
MRLTGIPVSPGISVGNAQIVLVKETPVIRTSVPEDRVEHEVDRLRGALLNTIRDVEGLKEQARGRLSEELLAIFDAHIIILKDPSLLNNAASHIRSEHINAEYAFQVAIQDMVKGLMATDDAYFQERASDLEDLRRRTLEHLLGEADRPHRWEGDNLVLLADTLTPSETGALHNAPIVGFATEHGARTSHTAIVARSLEIPAVVGVKGLMEVAPGQKIVIVDGLEGVIILDPTEEEAEEYRRRAEAYREQRRQVLAHALEEARTIDGHRVLVSANVDLTDEVKSAIEVGANGVGLYRSEFLFLDCSPELPTEAQHQAYYDRIAEPFYPHRVVIRTLDLGGEKYFHAVLDKSERNPVLGVRAVRFCLKHPEIFKAQFRGLLRSSVRRNVAILIPLITTLEELKESLALLEECKVELRAAGVPFDEEVPVGIMIEVPSAALTAEAFAPYVDFFSIGTNDLIQYLLAIDRNNDSVAHLYDPMHPAVLKCIAGVCAAGADAGKPVTVCGEVAADPRMTPLLLGLGVTELSMTPSSILDVKERVRNLSLKACSRLAKKALQAHTGREVAELVDRFIAKGERSL